MLGLGLGLTVRYSAVGLGLTVRYSASCSVEDLASVDVHAEVLHLLEWHARFAHLWWWAV